MITFFKHKNGSATGINFDLVKKISIESIEKGGRAIVVWTDGGTEELEIDLSLQAESESSDMEFDFSSMTGQVQ